MTAYDIFLAPLADYGFMRRALVAYITVRGLRIQVSSSKNAHDLVKALVA